MSSAPFHAEVRTLRRERILEASAAIIAEQGWDALNMTAVARQSGVPRQMIYRDVGDRAALGRAVVDREVDRFLGWVREGLAAHPDSVTDAVAAAALSVLEHGRGNPLISAILRPGRDSELLALVTVDPAVVLGQATAVVSSLLCTQASEALVDSVVRLTVSHLLQPTVSVTEAVKRVARIADSFDASSCQ